MQAESTSNWLCVSTEKIAAGEGEEATTSGKDATEAGVVIWIGVGVKTGGVTAAGAASTGDWITLVLGLGCVDGAATF